ncbi:MULTISPECIES: YIP1 family protein [Halobacterium]|uniref:YIP1 family protein n=1 Tax=Halobacterium TaxID=2239 RepID=UPI00073E4A16|nr:MULTISPECIES: YIP1 family protein [Halobacterium]MCG1002172.1 YIP1 family protein [Halobacterium noricense]
MRPRTPVLHPTEYFERRGFDLRPALVVVGVAGLIAVAPVVALGALATEQFASAGGDATSAFWLLLSVYVAILLSGIVTFPLVTGAVLHALGRVVCDGDGEFANAFVVASWGLLPVVPVLLAVLGSFATSVVGAASVTPQSFLGNLYGTLTGDASLPALAAGFLVAGWQTRLYGRGLSVAFDAESSRPLLAGGAVAYGYWLLALF